MPISVFEDENKSNTPKMNCFDILIISAAIFISVVGIVAGIIVAITPYV